jgi:hypothetical protein
VRNGTGEVSCSVAGFGINVMLECSWKDRHVNEL